MAVLFDLDGTLVETRQDIATGVNLLLVERGYAPMPVDAVARYVGHGARNLITRCLEESGAPSSSADDLEQALHRFRIHYGAHLLETTHAYPGIPDLLGRLARAGIALAVVTNKPEDLSRGILRGLDLSRFFRVVIGGESLPERKPHPGPLLQAREELAAQQGETLMVGDSTIDIEAARAARVAVAAVTWGFSSRESLIAASPDYLPADPAALGDWILG